MNAKDALDALDYLNMNLSLVNAGLFLLQLLWSLFFLRAPRVPRSFMFFTYAMYLLTGAAVLLHFYTLSSGHGIPSGRSGAHLRYVVCQLLTVVAAHLLGSGKLADPKLGVRLMWLMALFGLGVSFEAFRVYLVGMVQ
ncbi:hypothetical protein [Deinococcus roseus]|nr:hypothetical protein [Deinococcus roseus]